MNKKGENALWIKADPDGLLKPDGSATPCNSGLQSIRGGNNSFSHVCKIQKVFEKTKRRAVFLAETGNKVRPLLLSWGGVTALGFALSSVKGA